jgi:hypothetical protein
MTVEELIKELQGMPMDAEVRVKSDEYCEWTDCTAVDLENAKVWLW